MIFSTFNDAFISLFDILRLLISVIELIPPYMDILIAIAVLFGIVRVFTV